MATQRVFVNRPGRLDISMQNRVDTTVTYDHRCVRDARVAAQLMLDLREFDPITAELDLLVDTSEVLDLSVRQPAGQIAGAIDAIFDLERVVDKTLPREFRTSMIAARQPDAGDAEFAGHADRLGPEILVDNVQPDIVDRAADRPARASSWLTHSLISSTSTVASVGPYRLMRRRPSHAVARANA